MQDQSTIIHSPVVAQQRVLSMSMLECPPAPPAAVKCQWPKGSFSVPLTPPTPTEPLQKRHKANDSLLALRRRPRYGNDDRDAGDMIKDISAILEFLPPPPLYVMPAPSSQREQVKSGPASSLPIRKLNRESSLRKSLIAKSA